MTVLSVGSPRVSARVVKDLDDVTTEWLVKVINNLKAKVAREADGMPITRRLVYITYEEVAEWEPPTLTAA